MNKRKREDFMMQQKQSLCLQFAERIIDELYIWIHQQQSMGITGRNITSQRKYRELLGALGKKALGVKHPTKLKGWKKKKPRIPSSQIFGNREFKWIVGIDEKRKQHIWTAAEQIIQNCRALCGDEPRRRK